jgi:CheY-like chemotaxis protein
MRDQAVVLLVEDREEDVVVMLRSFERAQIINPVQVVRDGDEAIAYLKGEGQYANRAEHPLPELVLLDLKMPRVDGFEVLQWIREQPQLRGLRVVVLTSSEHVRDVSRAYQLGANSFLVKPMDFARTVELSSFISDYWLGLSLAPETARAAIGPDTADPWAPPKKKVLLRDTESLAYYAGFNEWVSQVNLAFDFERVELAESVALAENMRNVEIVLRHEQPECDLAVPVIFPGVRRP